MFPKYSSMIRRLASLRRVRQGVVPRVPRYYQDTMTSCRPSRVTSLPSFGGTTRLHLFSLSRGECHPVSLELVTRYSFRECSVETTGSPKFLGNPKCPFAHALRLR